MKGMILAIALVLSSTTANAFTCAQVRWAVKTLPTSVIEGYKKLATPDDLKKATACLRNKHGR